MAEFEFTVDLRGYGNTEKEAWLNAVDAFCIDPGEPSGVVVLEDEDEEEV